MCRRFRGPITCPVSGIFRPGNHQPRGSKDILPQVPDLLEHRLLKRLVLNLRCEFVMQISLHITRQFNFTLYILGRVSRIIVSPVVWFRPARGTALMTRILTGFIIAIPLFTRTWTRRNSGQTPPFIRRFGRAWRLTPFRLLFFNMLLRGVVINWFGCECQENTLLYLIEVCEVKSMLWAKMYVSQ